jgi:hypothetical protein
MYFHDNGQSHDVRGDGNIPQAEAKTETKTEAQTNPAPRKRNRPKPQPVVVAPSAVFNPFAVLDSPDESDDSD